MTHAASLKMSFKYIQITYTGDLAKNEEDKKEIEEEKEDILNQMKSEFGFQFAQINEIIKKNLPLSNSYINFSFLTARMRGSC